MSEFGAVLRAELVEQLDCARSEAAVRFVDDGGDFVALGERVGVGADGGSGGGGGGAAEDVRTRMPAQLPDDIWDKIIEELMQSTGLYAAKQLNRLAGLSTVFARAARAHPDNHVPHDV